MLDRAHQQQLEAALIASIVSASIVEVDGQRVAAVRMGELVEAAIGVLASLISTSATVATPELRQAFADQIATRLARRIAACRENHAEHGVPFATMPVEAGTC